MRSKRAVGLGLIVGSLGIACSADRKFDESNGGAGDGGSEEGGAAGVGAGGGKSGAETGGDGAMLPAAGAGGTMGESTCADDEYETDGGCQSLTVCAPDEFEKVPPGPKQDRVCGKAAQCADTEYEASPPSASSDRLCSPLTICGAGTFVSTEPSADSDRACEPCDSGKFSRELNAAACTSWSECQVGETESVPPSAASDRVCSTCGAGKYENAGQCVALTVCSASQYESTPATATSDRACTNVQSCAPGTRQTAAPTTTTDRQCAACSAGTFSTQANASNCQQWTVCGPNQTQSVAGTATSDVVCVDKPVCSTAADRTCTIDCPCPSGVGVCTASNQCASGASCVAGSGKKVGRAGDTCLANHCNNDTKDGGETSVDCGGDCGCRATFETVTVKGLPANRNAFYAVAMSRDGQRIAGALKQGNLSYPGTMAPDGTVTALESYGREAGTRAISGDGNVVVAEMLCANPPSCSDTTLTTMAWTGSAAPQATGTTGNPRALSSSGSIIVGDEYNSVAGGNRGFYRVAGKNTVTIDAISLVAGMTADGQYVVGSSTSDAQLALWAASTGNVTKIGLPAWSNIDADAINGIGANPTVVGNAYISASDSRVGFRWKGGMITELATLSTGNFIYASGVSQDGGTVVGLAGPSGNQPAFIWTDAGQLRSIVDELRARGLEPALDFTLGASSFLALSDDGKTIVGSESVNTFWRAVLQ